MRIVTIAATAFLLAMPLQAADNPATISVTGEGQVELAPDMATINLGVTTEDRAAAAALSANSERLAQVISALKDAGIEGRDIQTAGLALNPRYDYSGSNGAPFLTGYIASNSVTVRVRDLSLLGRLMDTVVTQGANTLNGPRFGLQDDAAPRDDARRLAVEDAARKAAIYANAAGVTLGPILSITEAGAAPAPMPFVMAAERYAKAADVPVAEGELTISDSVAILYAIAPE
ncbi:MAG: SIMPL domain-containing protein [Rhodobacteraceae bacterium]|nr:SIMPL domain-containing protein [Paracoccaceae bacterium]